MDTQLTPTILAALVGGQMEIQNHDENYIYRGELKTLAVQGNELHVEFTWLAKGDNIPPAAWKNDDKREYRVNLEVFLVSNVGPSGGDVGGGDRWLLTCHITGETAVIFPPDGSKLNPSKVEGLELARV